MRVPPLRERMEDLPLLVDEILAGLQSTDPSIEELRSDAFQRELERYSWPGNVRELKNHIVSCWALDRREPPAGIAGPAEDPLSASLSLPLSQARNHWKNTLERRYLEEALRRHRGNVSAAARASGVDRRFFHRLLERHGLRRAEAPSSDR